MDIGSTLQILIVKIADAVLESRFLYCLYEFMQYTHTFMTIDLVVAPKVIPLPKLSCLIGKFLYFT